MVCKYPGDTPSVAFKIEAHQIWSMYLLSLLPTLEQEAPIWEDEGRTETKAEGNAQRAGGGWDARRFLSGALTSCNLQLLGWSSPGRAEQGPCDQATPTKSALVSGMAFSSIRAWFLVHSQVLWWFHPLHCSQETCLGVREDVSFLRGSVGHREMVHMPASVT